MGFPQKLADKYYTVYNYVFYKRNLSGPCMYIFLSVFGYFMIYSQCADKYLPDSPYLSVNHKYWSKLIMGFGYLTFVFALVQNPKTVTAHNSP